MTLPKREVRHRYDEVAPRFDRMEALPEWLGLRRLRKRLLRHARGEVLEVAAGTGRNLAHYPAGCRVTGLDLSAGMLQQARRAAEASGVEGRLVQADAERLPFAGDSFDTVVDAMTLCTYPDPVRALTEMARVCRPDGSILLLEHGRSDHGWLAWFQDRRAEKHARSFGCRWNREPRRLTERAGLRVREAERTFFGIYHTIRAAAGTAGADAADGGLPL